MLIITLSGMGQFWDTCVCKKWPVGAAWPPGASGALDMSAVDKDRDSHQYCPLTGGVSKLGIGHIAVALHSETIHRPFLLS